MKNEAPPTGKKSYQSNESNRDETPLFPSNIFPSNICSPNKNAAPQIPDVAGQLRLTLEPLEEVDGEVNAALQKLAESGGTKASPGNPELPMVEAAGSGSPINAAPQQKRNAAPHSISNAVPHQSAAGKVSKVLRSSRATRPKNSRSKKPVEKIHPAKRNVVPLKLFVSPLEKAELTDRAQASRCSLSNYIRINLGLSPNETGRKKQNVVAAFDLSDWGFDEEQEIR